VLFTFYRCTRGYRAHRAPGIPCALRYERAERTGQTSREMRGEIAKPWLMLFEIESMK
jgi:hypothetical protein